MKKSLKTPKNKAFNRKQLIKDNILLETHLEQCRASNTELVIMMEQNEKAISESNINELIAANEKLRDKYSRVRKRLTRVMEKFNITYNSEIDDYEIRARNTNNS